MSSETTRVLPKIQPTRINESNTVRVKLGREWRRNLWSGHEEFICDRVFRQQAPGARARGATQVQDLPMCKICLEPIITT
jgi:hypothetical protein